MGTPNSELARRGYDALNRNDWTALQALVAPDVELNRAPGLGSIEGADAVIGFAAPEVFEQQRFEIAGEVLEREDRLLVPLRVTARGKGSSMDIEQDVWHVVSLRAGRIARLEIFFDRGEALGAFGT